MATYADDIKRLAQGDKLRDALGAWAARDPINGSITPYINAAFSTSSNGGESGTDNATADSTNENGSTEQDGTQPTDGSNPITFYKGGGGGVGDATQTGQQDMESVINGDVPQQTPTGSYDVPIYSGEGGMTSVGNMTDCDDNSLNVRFDGEYSPPDGWDDADSPPEDATFRAGFYWRETDINFPDPALYSTLLEMVAAYRVFLDARLDFLDAAVPTSAPHYYIESTLNPDVTSWGAVVYTAAGSGVEVYAGNRVECTPSESDPLCPLTAPAATEWPIDGKYNLSLVDGTFQANQYDSEAPANAGGSSVDVKYGDSGTARITATAQGGYMIYATAACGGAATGIVKVYNSDGTFEAAGDATQTFFDQYLPV